MVPSISTYSKSASADKALNRRSKRPFLAHLRKRRNTEFHSPNSLGRSRHGAPVLAVHKTASRNSRLSLAERPRSPSFPGSNGATRSHYESLIMRRGIHRSPFAAVHWHRSHPLITANGSNVHRPKSNVNFPESGPSLERKCRQPALTMPGSRLLFVRHYGR